MIYPHGPKFVFIHIAKSGGTSITKTLANYLKVDRDEYRSNSLKFIRIADVCGTSTILGESSKNAFDDYYIFSCVRNPFDRLVSYFHYRKQIRKPPNQLPAELTFGEWVRNNGHYELTKMVDQLCFPGSLTIHPRIDYVANLEDIEFHWPIICSDLGIQTPLLHDKASSHEHYSKYYDEETRRIVERHYKSDLLTFDYGFEKK